MTAHAVERRFFLRVTVHAETHVDFKRRRHAIHRFHRAVTSLASHPGMNMRPMREAHEVGQRVHAIPLNLERRRRFVRPRPRHRLDSASRNPVAVASHAFGYRRDARFRRSTCIGMAIRTGNLVHPGVYSMAKWYRLNYVCPGRPWPLRQRDHCPSQDQHRQGKRQHYPVYAHDQACE